MLLLATVCIALATILALTNLAGLVQAGLRGRRGESGSYSSIPLLSLLLCIGAWLLAGDRWGAWAFLPALVDPSNWLMASAPFLRGRGRRQRRTTRPAATRATSSPAEHPPPSDQETSDPEPTPGPVVGADQMPFSVAVAAESLGLLLPEQLPEVATDAMVGGLDSTSLAALAGESPKAAYPDELHRLFGTALRELGISRPAPVDAARLVVDHYARRVVTGTLTPRAAARLVVRGIVDRVGEEQDSGGVIGSQLGVQDLVGLHYGYEEADALGRDASEIDAAVVLACRRWLDRRAAESSD